MGQTVNLLAYAFGGSNPSLPTQKERLVNVLKMISKLLIYYTKHITQKVNKSLNVLLIQSKIVIKVLSMNLI